MKKTRRFLVGALAITLLAVGQSVVPVGPTVAPAQAATVGTGDCVQTVSDASGVVLTTPTVNGRGTCQVHFTQGGPITWTIPEGILSFSVLVVGAGGGGGADAGGGGGGGAVFDGTISLANSSAASSMSISVGTGGLPAVHTSITGEQPFDVTRNPPTSGGNSSISVVDTSAQTLLITANGGSAGGYGDRNSPAQGGSGGSVSVVNSSALISRSGTSLVGASGGTGVAFAGMSSGTAGGNGFSLSSFPSNATIGGAYGGGGGGGASIGADTDVGGAGGSGGGGSGGGGQVSLTQGVTVTIDGRDYSGAPQTANFARVFASAGVANTGGGGGSGSANQQVGQYSIDGVSNHSRNGRSGGSGVVVIRYELPLGTVAATSVNEITTTTATVASSVTSSSSVTARGFVFGESTDPTIGAGGVTNVTAGSGTGSFTANLTGLTMGTTYYVRAYATNGGGTAYGATQVFTTAPNTITTTAGSIRWFEGPTVVDAGLSITGADISGASVSIENNKTGDVLACPSTSGTGISCAYNTSSGVLTLSGSATANVYQTVMRGITFSASNVSTNTDNRTILFNLGGSLTFDPASGHYYEIVTVSSGGSVYSTGNPNGTKGDLSSGGNISWEESRCRAKYTNASFSGTLESSNMDGTTRVAGRTTQANDGCVVNGGGSLVPRTLNGLPGHLANITSLAEHQFLRTKLTGTGWIGGSDIDLEGTWIWMDGPEAGQVFWVQGTTNTRRGVNSVSGVDRFNYWSDGEPNNASGEHWAEFGFGSAGVGSSWNDCRNGCGRTTYIVEYSASGGVVPPALSATRIVALLPSQSITFSPSSSLVYGAPAMTLSATSSEGVAVSLSVTTGDGTTCSLAGTTLSWVGPGNCVVTATAPGSDTDGGYQPAAPLNRTIEMTRKNLPITGLSAVSREYNRASGVTVTGTAVFNDADLVAGDAGSVSVGGTPAGTVANSTVGSNKAVTVSGVTLSGARAFAYQPVVSGVTVNITVRPVRLAGSLTVADRDYNGAATVTPSSTSLTLRAGDVIAGDNVILVATYVADSANAGSRVASPQASLSGVPAANYILDTTGQPTASFTIDPLSLTVASGTFSVQNRTADGSVVATIPSNDLQLEGFLAGESISDITWTPRGVFDSAAAGVDKVVTLESGAVFAGAKGLNYVLDITGAPTSLGTITAAPAAPAAPVAPVQQAQPPVNLTPTPVVPRRGPIIRIPQEPRVQSSPVLRGGRPSAPPSAPTSLVNGVPTPVTTQVTNPNSVNIQTGALSLGLNVQNGQGGVRQGTGGATELDVTKGGQAAVQGSGLQPRSFVQVFLPLQGDNAREIGRLAVDESGSFNGDLVFGAKASENQLPIGRNVLQILSVDEQGRQSVVEMAVNVAQPPPAPEINRQIQLLPTLDPGVSVTTRDGFPISVILTTSSAQGAAVVAGDGWTMSVGLGDENSVGETGQGAVIRFTRDQTASVTGTGFMPGTRADIWIFSEPTLLGSVEIGEDGGFSGLVNIDSNVVPVGDHTLQLQGVGTDGYVLATNLGVVVADIPETSSSTVEQAAGFMWWIVFVLGITALLVAAFIVRHRVSLRRS